MAYQLQEINRRIQTDVKAFLAECDESYAQRVSLAADKILSNLDKSPIVLLSGPSGSGKTTLLNCVSTIDRPTSGSILVDGKELSDLRGKELARFRRERLGFIFQDCNLLDTLTAFENIALALSIVRTPAGEIREQVEENARLLGIQDCLDKYPYQIGRASCRERV